MALQRVPVVIYTHSLLAGSMTFIRSHAEGLTRHVAIYGGAHRVVGLSLPPERTYVANAGGANGMLNEFLFRRFDIPGRFVRQLAIARPELVHAHFGESGPAGLTIARSLGVPLIVTFHGKDATMSQDQARRSFRGRHLLRRRTALIRGASCFIAVSNFIRDQLLARGFPSDKIVVHRNGVDTQFFCPSDVQRERLVVFVGRFVEKKGCAYLLEAIQMMHRRGKPARLVLIGDGPLRPRLEAQARASSIDAQFIGFCEPAAVRDWLNKAAAVAVPSVTASDGDSEGLPTIVLEAQAMATPVVATRHAGIPEGVVDNSTAFLVSERNADEMADRLARFVDDPSLTQVFGARARAFVQANFALERQVSGLEDIYERVRCRERPSSAASQIQSAADSIGASA